MRILIAGARGEVGRSLAAALRRLGHEVVAVSARAPFADDRDVLSLDAGRSLVREGAVDAVVNASGKGDRRLTDRSGQEATGILAAAVASAGLPSVLISTMRVAEGRQEPAHDGLAALPETPYARANAENERVWMAEGGGPVLRLVNFLCPPAAVDSPQALLLPWSLVVDGARDRRIDVRSGSSHAKEFIDADDAASACSLLLGAAAPPPTVATVPGALFTMRLMAEAAADALAVHGFGRPALSFGSDAHPDAISSVPGWLDEHGWAATLSARRMSEVVAAWVGDRRAELTESSG